MESVASREQKELLRREAIQRQISQLQAQLSDPNAPCPSEHNSHIEDSKRKHSNGTVLAPASPDRSKQPVLCRYEYDDSPRSERRKTAVPHKKSAKNHRNLGESCANDRSTVPSPALQQPGPSNVISKLSTLSKRASSPSEQCVPERTSSFADKAR